MRCLLAILLLSVSTLLVGQNLVPNPSFENLDPNKIDTINWTRPSDKWDHSYVPVNWFLPTIGSSNIFNTQGLTSGWGVPLNLFGQQAARSGNSYAGLYTYANGSPSNNREYISVGLLDSLIIETNYHISFNVSRADDHSFASLIGAFLGSDSISLPAMFWNLNFIPQVESPNAIINKTQWVRVAGSYIATGGEKYLTIGNFKDDVNSDTTFIESGLYWGAYYYIDDVCVSTDSLECYNFVGVKEQQEQHDVIVYPNPTQNYFTIEGINEPFNLSVYNNLGQIIHKENNVSDSLKKIDISGFSNGLLFLKLELEDEVITRKIIKE